MTNSLPLSLYHSPSPGVLFLQFGDETRRVHITHELSSLDTLHALIVHMFPQKLTAGMLKSSNTAILIKDEARNVFYELEDIRDIQDRSIIKIYRKEPIYASYPGTHLVNGDLRVRQGGERRLREERGVLREGEGVELGWASDTGIGGWRALDSTIYTDTVTLLLGI